MSLTVDRPAVDLATTDLTASIGAEVHGLSLRDELSDRTVESIRALLVERKVLFFRDQHLTPSEHGTFARRFGELTPSHPIIPGIAGHPEVFEIDYTAAREFYGAAARYDGVGWHTDVTFVPRPPLGSILNAVEMPTSGGDTLWSNQEAAFEGLSLPIQELLKGLTAVHNGQAQFGHLRDRIGEAVEWEDGRAIDLTPVSHPVVRVHPDSGRTALFVNPGFTQEIEGLRPHESTALLQFLYAHSVREEYTVRWHWRTGDVAFWDNRSTQHAVVGDFGDAHRVIQRVTLRGTEPVGVGS